MKPRALRAIRRTLLRAAAAAALAHCLAAPAAHAQPAAAGAWPAKPIRLLIPLAAGGATDRAARLMAGRLSTGLGQPVVAENVTGASGTIALQRLANAAPDGYTLAATANSLHTVAPHMSSLPYDPMAAFSFVGTYAAFDYVLVVGAPSPIASLPDLVERARKAPGKVTFGSSGVGTGNHLAAVLLGQMAGVELNSVPYRGGSPAMVDVLAGHTDFMLDVVGGALAQIEAGKARALGVSGTKPHPLLPKVAPIAASVPGYESGGWFALIGPAGLPAPIVQRLNAALNEMQASADFKGELMGLGYQTFAGTPGDVEQRVRTETAKWKDVVGRLNAQAGAAKETAK